MSTQDTSGSYRNETNKIKVAQVLIRLGAIYGHIFTSNHKTDEAFDAAVIEWSASIGKYDYDRLDKAIEKCKTIYKKTVTLPEFMDCLKVSQYQAMLDRDEPKLLPKIETEDEKKARIKRGEEGIKEAMNEITGLKERRLKLDPLDYDEAEILKELGGE